MSIREYLLNEVFDSSVNVTIVKSLGDEFMTSFTVDGEKYYFTGKEYEKGEFVVAFYRSNGMFEIKGDSKNTTKIIGSVFKSIRMMISDREVNYIGLSTDNPKLTSLYDKLVRHFEREVNGFKLDKRDGTWSVVKWVYRRVV